MAEVVLTATVAALLVVVLFMFRAFLIYMRGEATAARMERAELLQRIQAPDAAVSQYAYKTMVQPELANAEAEIDQEAMADREWMAAEESLVPFDEDLV